MKLTSQSYRWILMIMLCGQLSNVFASTHSLIDSLKSELAKTNGYEEQSTLLKKIGDKFYEINQDSTAAYYQKSLEAANQSDNHKDDIIILRSFAHLYV